MGIHDRDYYQPTRHTNPLRRVTSSAVGTLIVVNLLIWLAQAFTEPRGAHGPVTEALSANAEQVFSGFQFWRLFTANFAHDPNGFMHVLVNMLFLFFFGPELEQIYGKRDFCLLYIGAGVLAVLAELVALQVKGAPGTSVLGASGAVLAILVVFTLFYPNRTILVLFVPLPVWIFCVFKIVQDMSMAFAENPNDGVAHFAHLTGALSGFLFRRYDLRWPRIRGAFSRVKRRGAPRATRGKKIIQFPSPKPPSDSTPEVAAISKRIDALLEKIHTDGKNSLTHEEWEFLKTNSEKYRSPKG